MQTAQERNLLARAENLGITVEFAHCRAQDIPFCPNSKGGSTYCSLVDETQDIRSRVVGYGTARCSLEDNFNKGIGRAIALGRAFKDYDERS